MKLLKYEFYNLFRDRVVWATWLAIIAFGLLIAYLGRHNFIGTPVEIISPLVLSNPFLPMWTGVVLAPVFFGLDFQNRTLNIAVCLGYNRIKILVAKAFWYYLYSVLALFISTVCTVWISCGNIVLVKGIGEKLVLLFLIYCATLTIPMIPVIVFSDMFAATAINVIFTYTMQRLIENETVSHMLYLYPPCLQLNISTFNTRTGILTVILTSILYVVIGFLICFYTFKARELK